jgi:hypothetical protein
VKRLGAWVSETNLPAFGGDMPRWQLALAPAARAGILAFGPNRGTRVTFVRLDQWVGPLRPVHGQAALQEVTRRYLRAFGPTTPVELARWLYTTPAATREVLQSLAGEVETVDVEGWQALDLVGHTPATRHARRVHLLAAFDSYVVGCHPRTRLIPRAAPEPLQRGTAAPFAVLLLDGVVGGLWKLERRGARACVRVSPFDPLSDTRRRDLDREAERLGAFLGLEPRVEIGHVAPRGRL